MKKASLRQKVYTSLKLDIMSGKLAGGTRITENFIADSLGVSRTPVREALQKLTQEKLLVAIPKAGYLIEDLSDNDIKDLFDTRMQLENIAFAKASQSITAAELKALDDNLEMTKAAIKSGDAYKITELDVDFHSILFKAARSKSLFRVCKNFSDLTLKYRHQLNINPRLTSELLNNHISIYQAILSKDQAKIFQSLEQHCCNANAYIVEMMQKQRSDAFSLEEF